MHSPFSKILGAPGPQESTPLRNFIIFSSLKQLPSAFVLQDHALNCLHDFAYSYRCLRRSKLKGMDHFGAKFGKEAVDRCKPNFTTIWERHGAVACKNRLDIFCRLSTMHERDKQINRQTDNGTLMSIAIGEIA